MCSFVRLWPKMAFECAGLNLQSKRERMGQAIQHSQLAHKRMPALRKMGPSQTGFGQLWGDKIAGKQQCKGPRRVSLSIKRGD